MGFFSSLFQTGKLNSDPEQQALARALLDSVENNHGHAKREIFEILVRNGWSRSEQGNRLTHACSMTKVWRPDLYPQVAKLAKALYLSL